MMIGSTISKEFEIISLVFSVAGTVSSTIGTFGNMTLSIPRNWSKNNYFPMNIIKFCNIHFLIVFFSGGGGGGRGWWRNLGNYLLESGRGQHK